MLRRDVVTASQPARRGSSYFRTTGLMLMRTIKGCATGRAHCGADGRLSARRGALIDSARVMVERDGIGSPDEPWDGEAWHARVQSGVLDPQRVAAVEATGLLDSTPDESFDQLALRRVSASMSS